MILDWQSSLALTLVVVAGGYLARRAYRIVARKAGGCGACGSCAADKTPAGKTLVTLNAPAPSPPERSRS